MTVKPRIQPFKFKPFSRRQRQVLNWWCDNSPVKDKTGIIADGAIRSGKTISMSLSFIIWAMTNFDNENFALCGKTVGSLRRNVLIPLKRMLMSRGYDVEEHRTDNLWIVSDGDKNNSFWLFGGRDERSQDLIQGITLAGLFMDEVALMPESFVNQAVGRCSVAGSKIWMNCNPAGPLHFIKKDWIDKAVEKQFLHVRFTIDDNLSLSDEIKNRLKSMFSGTFYKRYILGQWAAAEGLIYDMFSPDIHVYPDSSIPFPDQKKTKFYVSCDYGTQNATVFLLWYQDKEGIWRCCREYYYSGRDERKQKTDAEFADDLADWLAGIKPEAVVIDPAAASFIAEVRKRGYHVRKGKNAVLDGIRYTSSLLLQRKIRISDACKHLIEELQSYCWDSKAAEHGEDKPVKVADHCVDAMRYHCFTIIKSGGGMSVLK